MRLRSIFGRFITTIGVFVLTVYFFVRIYYYVFSLAFGFVDVVVGLALLLAESHSILHALGFLLNVRRLQTTRDRLPSSELIDANLPNVVVLLPVRNEPPDIVQRTLMTVFSLSYVNKRICLLDGSTTRDAVRKNRNLAKRYGAIHFVPKIPPKSKAAIINQFLPRIKEKYLVMFDADHNPMPHFLRKTVSIAEADPRIAFVQTPQIYTNIDVSRIAKSAALQQSIFFESICEAKNLSNAMFCCGTNVLMRTSALKQIGGFDELSVTEDFSSSVDFHALGLRSVYYHHALAFGLAPESLPAYLRQQARWAAGTTQVLLKLIALLIRRPRALTVVQWWEYFLSASYYLVGWAFFILMCCPILYLLFGVPSYSVRPEIYLASFIPYYVMTTVIFYSTMKRRRYSAGSVLHGILMASVTFPFLMAATVSGLVGRRLRFLVTPKGKGGHLNLWQLWPWHAMLCLNLLAIGSALLRWQTFNYAIGVNALWCLYHAWMISRIYRLNAEPHFSNVSMMYATKTNDKKNSPHL